VRLGVIATFVGLSLLDLWILLAVICRMSNRGLPAHTLHTVMSSCKGLNQITRETPFPTKGEHHGRANAAVPY
jgi:hypothetical protein